MIRAALATLATTLCIGATPVAAATIADVYSSFWVFGDSLSDNGNIATLFPGFPPPPYAASRFSNGPVWNERFLAEFPLGRSANFAFGAARAAGNADGIPDLPDQVAAFGAALPGLVPGDRALASLLVGANDMFAATAAAAAAATVDPASIPGILSAAVTATTGSISKAVATLGAHGIEEFVLWNLPDIGATPRLRELGEGAAGLGALVATSYNSAFSMMVDGLRTAGFTIHTVDTFALFARATANPAEFGLANIAEACLPVDPFRILEGAPVPAACDAPDTFLYWDKLHPTKRGHDVLAAAFDAAVPAIPLPAPALLLLAGLGALATLRRRAA